MEHGIEAEGMSTLVERLREAIAYSHNYATANPKIGSMEQAHILGLCGRLNEAVEDIERLTAERDAMRKDAERLDFLDSVSKRSHMIGKKKWPITSDMHIGAGQCVLYIRTGIGSECEAYGIGPTVREAIDAAREPSNEG